MTKFAFSNIVFLDTETGGLNCKLHSLLSVGLLNDYFRRELLISLPEYTVTPKAMEVNKLNLDTLRETGLSPEKVSDYILGVVSDDHIFVGHNIQFDVGFIANQLPGCEEITSAIMRNHIDTKAMALNAKILGKLPEDLSTSLGSLCEYFGISVRNHHNSLVDCFLTREVYYKLNKL